MKKQLLGLFSLAGLASSPLEVEVELINDTFDGSSNLTKNTGNDWFLHVDDADDQWHAADCSEWSHGVGSYFNKRPDQSGRFFLSAKRLLNHRVKHDA